MSDDSTPTEEFEEEQDFVPSPTNTFMSDKTYDLLKWLAQIVLPAVAALYFGLGQIWGFPAGEEVVGSIAVIDTFLGVVLGFSSRAYSREVEGPHVGFMNVTENEEGKHILLEFPGDPQNIDQYSKVSFKVRKR